MIVLMLVNQVFIDLMILVRGMILKILMVIILIVFMNPVNQLTLD